jgi:acyl-CoA reductase-like NAD-dependent aldehyde dehydrogenase
MSARLEVRKTYKMLIGGKFVRTESGRALRHGDDNIPRASRKDIREAVVAARSAFPKWAGSTAMLRGQVLYRAAEMLDARRAEFAELLGGGKRDLREVDDSVASLIWYAGWTDKLAQVTGTVNPVAAPYFTFSLPEPTGVVAVVAPQKPTLQGLIERITPALCGGNTVVALASEKNPVPALVLGEVLATSDLPPGAVNILSGERHELIGWLASHMDVNAIDVSGCNDDQRTAVELAAADNLKRVVNAADRSLDAINSCLETKTVWHPIGA